MSSIPGTHIGYSVDLIERTNRLVVVMRTPSREVQSARWTKTTRVMWRRPKFDGFANNEGSLFR